LTKQQLEILQHSLGVDMYGQTPKGYTPYTRNRFCAGVKDEDICRELVALGYMKQHETTKWLPYFNCSATPSGINAMRNESPAPPKLTRGQQRYRAFLEADLDITFREWIDLYARTA
jgi:hypothetical protein